MKTYLKENECGSGGAACERLAELFDVVWVKEYRFGSDALGLSYEAAVERAWEQACGAVVLAERLRAESMALGRAERVVRDHNERHVSAVYGSAAAQMVRQMFGTESDEFSVYVAKMDREAEAQAAAGRIFWWWDASALSRASVETMVNA